MRTIINPANGSEISSSVIRNELQLLETEIANTSTGHKHDGVDSAQIDHTSLSNTGVNTHTQIDTALTRLANTSNTNTGDETAATIRTKLGITTLSGSNTGDETTATIKSKLGITVLSGSNTGDQTDIPGNAATVTTNANLTGDITSIGNATTIPDITKNVVRLLEYIGAAGGTADAITLTPATPIASYAAAVGQRFLFVAAGNNTVSPPTINISGKGALNTTMGSVAVPIGGLISGNLYWALIETASSVRIAPYDAVSSNGDTVNGNLSAVNFVEGFATTATAGATTTLTVASKYQQFFTGTLAQTVVMPVATTLVNGQQWSFSNRSTGIVTINTSGGNTLIALAAASSVTITCINTAGGTGVASWDVSYTTDANIVTSDVTTNNVSTSKHGWFPKLPAPSGKFLKDDLTWATPAGAGNVTGPGSAVSGNIATYNGVTGTIIQDGGKSLPSGNILGDTDTQTLTNKTLTSPKINDTTAITTTGTELNLLHNQLGAWTAWTPSWAGFSANPTAVVARYVQLGKTVACSLTCTNGTSNATTLTVTLPVAAVGTNAQYFLGYGTNNASPVNCMLVTRAGSTTADVYIAPGGGAWTASGAKGININLIYETS